MKKKIPRKQNAKRQGSSPIDFESASITTPTDSELSLISESASRLINTQAQVEQLEAELGDARAALLQIATDELPSLMEQAGLSEFKLTDGSKVTVRPLINASLPTESAIMKQRDGEIQEEMRGRLKAGLKYLEKAGAGSIIKTDLKATFGRNAMDKAREARRMLAKVGIEAELATGVHSQSLNAWVRERLEAGKPVDMELFRVFNGHIAKVTQP